MVTRALLFLLLVCCSGAAWGQVGTYICPDPAGTEVVQLSERAFRSEVQLPQGSAREYGPLVRRGESGWVVGPLPDRMKPYEAIWLLEQKPDYLVLARPGAQYDLPSQVPGQPAPSDLKQGRRYWTQARYRQLLQLPVLPKPDRETLIELIELARDRLSEGSGTAALERALEDTLIERGYEPFQSKAVFAAVRRDLEAKDPELRRRLDELNQWLRASL